MKIDFVKRKKLNFPRPRAPGPSSSDKKSNSPFDPCLNFIPITRALSAVQYVSAIT